MKRVILTILAAAMALMAVALLRPDLLGLGSRGESPPAGPGPTGIASGQLPGTGENDPAAVAGRSGAGDERPTDDRVQQPAPAALGAILDLRVLGSDGAPCRWAAVTVERLLAAGEQDGTAWTHGRHARTDPEGHARVMLPAGTYLCSATLGGVVEVTLREGDHREIDLVVPPGGSVRGSVRDTQGHPIANAEVLLFEPGSTSRAQAAAVSAADGTFSFGPVVNGRLVAARHPAFAPATPMFVAVEPGVTAEVDLVLDDARGWLEGGVYDTRGTPVAGARVLLGNDNERARSAPGPAPHLATTGADGRFASRPLPPGPTLVRAHAPGFGPFRGTAEVRAGQTAFVRLTLPPGAAVAGRVTDDQGQPLAGVLLFSGRRGEFGSRRALSDGDGVYRLDDLAAGAVELTAQLQHARAEGATRRTNLTTSTQLLLIAAETAQWSPVFDTEALGAVRGRLLDADGTPLDGWRVVATRLGDGRGLGCEVDIRGRFEIVGLPRGADVSLRAQRPGASWTSFPDARLEPVRVDGPEVEFRVDRQAAYGGLTGRVLDARGQGLAATIEVIHEPTLQHASYPTDEEGNFRILPVPVGPLRVSVRHPRHPRLRLEPLTLPAGTLLTLGDLRLEVGGRRFGRITGPDHTPPPAQLELLVLDDQHREVGPAEWTGSSYTTPLLPPGQHSMLIRGEECAAVRVAFTVKPGEPEPLNIELHRATETVLRVFGEVPASGDDTVSLMVFDKSKTPIWFTHDRMRHGSATFRAWLDPGEYSVVAEMRGLAARRAEIVVEAGRVCMPPPIQLLP